MKVTAPKVGGSHHVGDHRTRDKRRPILARRAQGRALGVGETLARLTLDDRTPVRRTPLDDSRLTER